MKHFKFNITISSFATFAICLAIFSSCGIKEKLNDVFSFNFNEEVNFTIPSSSIVDLPFDFGTPDIESSGQQAFENNNTAASLVKEIYLSELILDITSPTDRTFSFLKSIQIYIRTNDNNEILLAEKSEIPNDVTQTLSLDTTGENLKAYMKEDTYSIRYKVITKETTNSETDITTKMTFTVNATEL